MIIITSSGIIVAIIRAPLQGPLRQHRPGLAGPVISIIVCVYIYIYIYSNSNSTSTSTSTSTSNDNTTISQTSDLINLNDLNCSEESSVLRAFSEFLHLINSHFNL